MGHALYGSMSDGLTKYLNDRRRQVENRLDALLRPRDGTPPSLAEAMRYAALSPGKRLRPLLVIMAAEAAGSGDADPLWAACSVEMVHAYSLIHDDLPAMDDDDLRRGQPSCHKQFGEALAILAGDALLTLAFQTLAENYQPGVAAGCCLELARGAGAAGMVGGQVEDLAWERSKEESSWTSHSNVAVSAKRKKAPAAEESDALDNIHARKTGALFRACLRLGAWVGLGGEPGGPNPAIMDAFDSFGRCFGLAFQITDDLLDAEGSAELTGKHVGKDIARGKLTYPGIWGADESRRRAGQLCQEACQHLKPLGQAGARLAGLAAMITDRSR